MNISLLKQILMLRKRTFIVITVLFAVALAFQLFLKLHQNPMVEKLQAELMKLREQEGRGAALQDRETLYRNGIADLAKFRERIYPKNQFVRFIGELYEMASKSGLELTSITYKPSLSKEDNLLSYALTLSVSGKYSQLKKFIYDLGSGNSNILVIDSIAMTASGPSVESVQLQLLITSWFKLEEK
jgi:Tfp pilus assembly protein PilO